MPRPRPRRARRRVRVAMRLLPTLAALAELALVVDLRGALAHLRAVSPAHLAAAIALHAAIVVALAWRWRALLGGSASRCRRGTPCGSPSPRR